MYVCQKGCVLYVLYFINNILCAAALSVACLGHSKHENVPCLCTELSVSVAGASGFSPARIVRLDPRFMKSLSACLPQRLQGKHHNIELAALQAQD